MSTKDELVKEWMHKADHDLGMAKMALEHNPEYTDSICFHCQQAAEKYLKSYLVYLEISFGKTHSLVYLLDLVKEKSAIITEVYEIAESLEGYAVDVRYPDDMYEPDIKEAKLALQNATEIIKFVKVRMQKQG